MKVFILEDDPARMMWLRERLIDHDITHAESCTEVDKFVGPYDLVLFDHDLGGRQMDEHEDDGAAFAHLVKDKLGDASVIIHSYNLPGALDIYAALGRGIYAPFRGREFVILLDKVEDGEKVGME